MIGVYDSGFGGLTVARAIRARLPEHDLVYLGDSGRAPYGGRDVRTILDFAEQCVERLFEEGCRLVVVACHTVSCVALRHLQLRYAGPGSARRVLGVSIPAAEAAARVTRGHIGVLGTARTIASRTLEAEIAKLSSARVSARPAPLLAPIVEEGWEDTLIASEAVRRYLEGLESVDTLLLGCTHYPLLHDVIARQTSATVIDPAPFLAERLEDWLARHPGFSSPGAGALRMLSTGDPETFARLGARFLGAPILEVSHVAEHHGRLEHRPGVEIVTGQIVR